MVYSSICVQVNQNVKRQPFSDLPVIEHQCGLVIMIPAWRLDMSLSLNRLPQQTVMVFELFYVNWKELLSKINRNVHNNSYISLLCTFSFHLWAAKKMKSLKKQNSIVQMPFCLMENLILTTFRKWRKILHCSWSNQPFLFSGYSCNFHEQDCITCFICIPFKLRQRKIEISCMDLLICLLEPLKVKVKHYLPADIKRLCIKS